LKVCNRRTNSEKELQVTGVRWNRTEKKFVGPEEVRGPSKKPRNALDVSAEFVGTEELAGAGKKHRNALGVLAEQVAGACVSKL
jgi:hypothetical protein